MTYFPNSLVSIISFSSCLDLSASYITLKRYSRKENESLSVKLLHKNQRILQVESDSMKTSAHISLSLAPVPPLSLSSLVLAHSLFRELPVGNVNRDFTAHCQHISQAHISPTCDLHQRRGSWGIFCASKRRRSCNGDASDGGGGWVYGGQRLVPWGFRQQETLTMVARTTQQTGAFTAQSVLLKYQWWQTCTKQVKACDLSNLKSTENYSDIYI